MTIDEELERKYRGEFNRKGLFMLMDFDKYCIQQISKEHGTSEVEVKNQLNRYIDFEKLNKENFDYIERILEKERGERSDIQCLEDIMDILKARVREGNFLPSYYGLSCTTWNRYKTYRTFKWIYLGDRFKF